MNELLAINFLETLSNVQRFNEALGSLEMQGETGENRIGLIYGDFGLGKSETVRWRAAKDGNKIVRADLLWTPRDMLGAILNRFGEHVPHRTMERKDRLVEYLTRNPQTLYLDEATQIARSEKMVTTLRNLIDQTSSRLMLVGEPETDQQLRRYGAFYSRLIVKCKFELLTVIDFELVAHKIFDGQGFDIDPDAIRMAHNATQANLREWMVLLSHLTNLKRAGKINKLNPDAIRKADAIRSKEKRK